MSEQGGALPLELFDANFLIRTGWTYDDYLNTPQEIISQMVVLWNAEAEVTRMKLAESRG